MLGSPVFGTKQTVFEIKNFIEQSSLVWFSDTFGCPKTKWDLDDQKPNKFGFRTPTVQCMFKNLTLEIGKTPKSEQALGRTSRQIHTNSTSEN